MVGFANPPKSNKTKNLEGGESFKLDSKRQLSEIIPTYLMGEPKFYVNLDIKIEDLIDEVSLFDPEFILKLASYTRNIMHLRTIPIYLLVKAANTNECKPFVKKYVPKIIKRADELYETVACHIKLFSERPLGKLKLPNSLKKGLAYTFNNFDEYSISKYNRKKDVTIKDVMSLVHPKRTKITKAIHDNTLKTPKTWETIISKEGSNKETWEKVVDTWLKNGKINNYMAILRNINNLTKNEISKTHWKRILGAISNKEAVKKSKQLPFRFYSAYQNNIIQDPFRESEFINALNIALQYSLENLPRIDGRTFIACDSSASMLYNRISNNSKMDCAKIGCLFGSMFKKVSNNAIIGLFDSDLKIVNNVPDNILSATEKLYKKVDGCRTRGHLTVKYLNENNIHCDRIIVLTDMEMYDGSFQKELNLYRKNINPDFKAYFVNLNGYGDTVVNPLDKNNVTITGWSERILEFITKYEKGSKTFVEEIEEYD